MSRSLKIGGSLVVGIVVLALVTLRLVGFQPQYLDPRSEEFERANRANSSGWRMQRPFPHDKYWTQNVSRDPRVRLKIEDKIYVVLRLLRGEPLDAVSREVGVEVYRLERWKARALTGLELGLKEQAGEPLAAALDAAKRHIGELSMENELLRTRARAVGGAVAGGHSP